MKITNKIAATALGVFLSVGAMGDFEYTGLVFTGDVSGDELRNIALSKTDKSERFFLTYTAGVLNAHGDSLKIFNDPTIRGWNAQYLKSIYVSYLERHPEYKYMNAAHSIRNALRESGLLVDKAQKYPKYKGRVLYGRKCAKRNKRR